MADIDIRRAHHMSQSDAKAAADRMADKLGQKFGLKGDWDGDTLRFQGTGVTGTLTVGPKDLQIAATLGFLLKAMRPSIEKAVLSELDSILAAPPGRGEPTRAAEKSRTASEAKGTAARKKTGPATTRTASAKSKKAR
jgi:putative polyhydroxyalkanoate system protein